MNYLIEIVIFIVVIFTICGINMEKKGKLGMIQEFIQEDFDRFQFIELMR